MGSRYSRKTFRTNTVIIGAGAAGLAMGACLRKRKIPFMILEQAPDVGSSWLQRYDRLHLHTHKNHSSLPYLSFPRHYPPYPSRLQFADYLELYAEKFRLAPRFGERVRSVMRINDIWSSRAKKADYLSRNLIIATGYSQNPIKPTWPGVKSFTGAITHSSKYKNGLEYTDQHVLVVGFGNSGAEIALDLHEHGARVSMAVRGPVNVMQRDIMGISSHRLAVSMRYLPTTLADKLSAPLTKIGIGKLSDYGLTEFDKGPLTQIKENERVPLLDVGTMRLIRQGHIRIFDNISKIKEDTIYFNNGESKTFDSIILATGFKHNVGTFFRDVNQVTDEKGKISSSGAQTSLPGLYFCGFKNAPYGFLREIGIEAKRIARLVTKTDTSIPQEKQLANERTDS